MVFFLGDRSVFSDCVILLDQRPYQTPALVGVIMHDVVVLFTCAGRETSILSWRPFRPCWARGSRDIEYRRSQRVLTILHCVGDMSIHYICIRPFRDSVTGTGHRYPVERGEERWSTPIGRAAIRTRVVFLNKVCRFSGILNCTAASFNRATRRRNKCFKKRRALRRI